MKVYFEYIKYILKHKYYVGVECFKRGLYWQGLIHDLSKFSSKEFVAYMNMYTRPKITGIKVTQRVKIDFNKAWLNHIHNNPHHWEYWVLDGEPLDMPDKYIKEMVCDWVGAGMAIHGEPNPNKWYKLNESAIILTAATKAKVEFLLTGIQSRS